MMYDDEDDRTIWCGNLSEKVSHDVLYELFYQAGPLDRVRIPRNSDGQQRNFGFVTYTHKESVPYAIELFRGTALYDRDLRMQVQKGSRGNSAPSTDLAMLLGRPLINDTPNIDANVEQKFISMTNQMIINGGFHNSEMFGVYDVQQQNHHSNNEQTQWVSRHNPGRDKRRHNPYGRNDHCEEGRGREWDRGRDRDRGGGGHRDRDNGGHRDRDMDRGNGGHRDREMDRGGGGHRDRERRGDRRGGHGRGHRY